MGNSSIPRRDGPLQRNRGDRSGWESSNSKREYREDGYSRSGNGDKSMSQRYSEHSSIPRQMSHKSHKFERSEDSSYAVQQDMRQSPKHTHKGMSRGRVPNRTPDSPLALYPEEQLSSEDDKTLIGKRPGSQWGDKHSSTISTWTKKDPLQLRHQGTEDKSPAYLSHRSLEVQNSSDEADAATVGFDFRKRKPAISIPYTTPASEFLYGTSVVLAALKSQRRKLYKLYVHDETGHHGSLSPQEATDRLFVARKMALTAGVEVVPIKFDSLPLMDKMSDGRPHNVRAEQFAQLERRLH